MKERVKNILTCLVFAVLLLAALHLCTRLLERKDARVEYGRFFESSENFDVIFMGTSHVYNTVMPMEIWRDFGIASYNWGYSNCSPAEDLYLFKDIVRHTKPKLLVIDLYGLVEFERFDNGKYWTGQSGLQHAQFDALPLSHNKIRGTRDVFDDYEGRDDFLWNLILYHDRWEELTKDDLFVTPSTQLGAEFLLGYGRRDWAPDPDAGTTAIESTCAPYLLELIDFCGERGIEVLCTYLPFPGAVEYQRVANAAADFLAGHACSYVNMMDWGVFDTSTDLWRDGSHLNYSGARKLSRTLGAYLREHYSLPDVSDRAVWRDWYEEYAAFRLEELRKTELLTDALQLASCPDYLGELVCCDSNAAADPVLEAFARNAGLEISEPGPEGADCTVRLVLRSAQSGETVFDAKYSQSGAAYRLEALTRLQ